MQARKDCPTRQLTATRNSRASHGHFLRVIAHVGHKMKLLKATLVVALAGTLCSCRHAEQSQLAPNQVAVTVVSVTSRTANWTQQHEVTFLVEQPEELRGKRLVIQPMIRVPSSAIQTGWPPALKTTLVVPPVATNLMVWGDDKVLDRMYPNRHSGIRKTIKNNVQQ